MQTVRFVNENMFYKKVLHEACNVTMSGYLVPEIWERNNKCHFMQTVRFVNGGMFYKKVLHEACNVTLSGTMKSRNAESWSDNESI